MVKRKHIVIVFIVGFLLLLSCGKKKSTTCEGSPNGCLGTRTENLTISTYIIIKDTTYKFVSSANDTIKLTSRTTYTYYENITGNCSCADSVTNVKCQNLISQYIFENKNLAMQYHVSTNLYLDKVFGIYMADTNNVLHQAYGDTAGGGLTFIVDNFATKKNDLDSILVNGKTYYNILTYIGSSSFIITNIYYVKGIGVIRFSYSGLTYNIL